MPTRNIWIAPFSPGFDARLVGGTKTVERKDGETLATQFHTAEQSAPDALGLISWNEFSENTYVEPSEQLGDRYLTVLRQLVNEEAPNQPPVGEADMGDSSSSPSGTEIVDEHRHVDHVRRRAIRRRRIPRSPPAQGRVDAA